MGTSARIDELRKRYEENPRRFFAPLASEYRKAGDLEQAVALCRAHLDDAPGNVSGQIVFGQSLFDAGEYDEARIPFEAAVGLDPENLIALRHLGDIARFLGQGEAAAEWYQRVLDADPRNDEVAELRREALEMVVKLPVVEPPAAPGPPPFDPDATPLSTLAVEAPSTPEAIALEPMFDMDGTAAVDEDLAVHVLSLEEADDLPDHALPLESVEDLPVHELSLDADDDLVGAGLSTEATDELPVHEISLDADDDLLAQELTMDTLGAGPASDLMVEPPAERLTLDDPLGFGEVEFDDALPAAPDSIALPAVDQPELAATPHAAPDASADPFAMDDPFSFGEVAASTEAAPAEPTELEPAFEALADPVDEDPAAEAPAEPVSALIDEPVVEAVVEVADAAADAWATAPADEQAAEWVAAPTIELPAEPAAAPFATETMAELYLRQGLRREAIAVYEQLLQARPGDVDLTAKLAALQAPESVAVSAPAQGPTARSVFAALAARRAVPTRTLAVPTPVVAVTMSVTDSAPPVAAAAMEPLPERPEALPIAPGSVAALFGAAPATAGSDADAASALAQAFGAASARGAGRSSTEGATVLGLDRLFQTASPAPSTPSAGLQVPRQSASIRFDQFFGGAEAAPGSAPAADPGAPPGPGASDAEFQNWLSGLKKP